MRSNVFLLHQHTEPLRDVALRSKAAALEPAFDGAAAGPWLRDLAASTGAEISVPLSAAVQRLQALAAAEVVDLTWLVELYRDIDRARRVGINAQQLNRLERGVQLHPERIGVAAMLREALAQRERELGGAVRLAAPSPEVEWMVVADAALLHALVHALFDWGLEHACSVVELQLGSAVDTNGVQGLSLSCYFAHAVPLAPMPAHSEVVVPASALDTVSWRLLQRCAGALGLGWKREDTPFDVHLMLHFGQPAAANDPPAEPEPPLEAIRQGRRQVLAWVMAPALRVQVLRGLAGEDTVIDFVGSLADVRRCCAAAMPHVLLYEAASACADLAQLRAQIVADWPGLVTLEIGDGCSGLSRREYGCGGGHARVAAIDLATRLRPALERALSACRTPL